MTYTGGHKMLRASILRDIKQYGKKWL